MNGYNGWTNRETWLVNLHFGDDTDYINELVEQADGDVDDLAQSLEDMIHDYIDEHLGNKVFIRDLMSLDTINWQELAEHYMQDYAINNE